MVSVVYACDKNGGISRKGSIPWNVPCDMKHFRSLTDKSIVVMGRKTWDSLPKRPLPNRINLVLTTDFALVLSTAEVKLPPDDRSGFAAVVKFFGSIHALLKEIEPYKNIQRFVIGGKHVWNQFVQYKIINTIYRTTIDQDFGCDLNMSTPSKRDWFTSHTRIIQPRSPLVELTIHNHINHGEIQVLDAMRQILSDGHDSPDRTGVGHKSIFCKQMRFNLKQNSFPLLTSRPVPLRMIFHELMWMLRGSTDVTELHKNGIHIWDVNSNEAYLKKIGSYLKEWDIGPGYGFQMRHSGAVYVDCKTDYKGYGVDQLANVVRLLLSEPHSRRIMINLWNPSDIGGMALPPCAYSYQFYVAGCELSCVLTQRSSDIALAGGWNIATASLLTILLAAVTGFEPHEVVWNPANIHIYNNQMAGAKKQVARIPRTFPLLMLNSKIKKCADADAAIDRLLSCKWEDLELMMYMPHESIKYEVN